MSLKPTSDRKVRFYKTQKNSLGLMPGREGTCPGATEKIGGCAYVSPGRKSSTCYVDNLMRCYKGVRGVLEHNTRLMKEAKTAKKMYDLLFEEFDRFWNNEVRRGRAGHYLAPGYRLHWSGDIFNEAHARAIAKAVKAFPRIKFWIYTRSMFSLRHITGIDNLVVYISLDKVNVRKGLRAYEKYKDRGNLRLCYMSKEKDFDGKLETETHNYANSMVPCPVDTGKLKLDGGCPNCGICLEGRANVWFKT